KKLKRTTLRTPVRPIPTACFIGNWNRTAPGAKPTTTVTSGNPGKRRSHATGDPTSTGDGPIRTPVGPGYPRSHLGGRPITTGDGSASAELAGFGCPGNNGRRPG